MLILWWMPLSNERASYQVSLSFSLSLSQLHFFLIVIKIFFSPSLCHYMGKSQRWTELWIISYFERILFNNFNCSQNLMTSSFQRKLRFSVKNVKWSFFKNKSVRPSFLLNLFSAHFEKEGNRGCVKKEWIHRDREREKKRFNPWGAERCTKKSVHSSYEWLVPKVGFGFLHFSLTFCTTVLLTCAKNTPTSGLVSWSCERFLEQETEWRIDEGRKNRKDERREKKKNSRRWVKGWKPERETERKKMRKLSYWQQQFSCKDSFLSFSCLSLFLFLLSLFLLSLSTISSSFLEHPVQTMSNMTPALLFLLLSHGSTGFQTVDHVLKTEKWKEWKSQAGEMFCCLSWKESRFLVLKDFTKVSEKESCSFEREKNGTKFAWFLSFPFPRRRNK